MVDAGELELVAGEHGDPVDPAVIAQSGALELIAAMTPGTVGALVLANNGASAGAVVCAMCLTAVVTIVYGERRGVLAQ